MPDGQDQIKRLVLLKEEYLKNSLIRHIAKPLLVGLLLFMPVFLTVPKSADATIYTYTSNQLDQRQGTFLITIGNTLTFSFSYDGNLSEALNKYLIVRAMHHPAP